MTEPLFIFRVDANKQIGTGHFYRCLYIARALKTKGAESVFFTANADNAISNILRSEGLGLVNIPNDQMFEKRFLLDHPLTNNFKKSLLVIDSPYPDYYQQFFQEDMCGKIDKLMIITFRSEGHFNADIIHNQNLLALTERYSVEPHSHLLLGPEYIILDKRYPMLRHNDRNERKKIETLFMFFGGADSANLTLQSLNALTTLGEKFQRVIAVVGPLYSHEGDLRAFISDHPELSIDLHVNTADMPNLMVQADLAITSGGINIWELACLGIPDIIISTSEREKIHTPLWEEKGACLYIGHYDDVTQKKISEAIAELARDSQRRKAMSKIAMNEVDGKGTERVVQCMMRSFEQ